MEWLASLKESIAYMEDHLREDISAADVARQVNLSPFYLQKGFQIMTGFTMGEYLRCRRLYEAGIALASGEKVIDAALCWGYDTPESFTKAFTRFHGATPTQVKADPSRLRPFLPLHIHMEITGGNRMQYTVTPMWGFTLIGFGRDFTFENAAAEIPKFREEICEKYCSHTIYAGLPPTCPQEQAIMDNCIGEYGVCIDQEGGTGFRYLIAGKYTGGEVPEGMELYTVPGGNWAKFKAIGPTPQSLQSLNRRIFEEWLPGNGEYELSAPCYLEWYNCDMDMSAPDYESAIWLPVQRKQ